MPATRPRPRPPRPELVRCPSAAFGWLDAHLLHGGWLARLGPDATAVLLLLALAADRNGASFYGRQRMAVALGMTVSGVDAALEHLRSLDLIAHRPWQPGQLDGVWQLLPLPGTGRVEPRGTGDAANAPVHIAAILAQLGIAPDRRSPAETDRR